TGGPACYWWASDCSRSSVLERDPEEGDPRPILPLEAFHYVAQADDTAKLEPYFGAWLPGVFDAAAQDRAPIGAGKLQPGARLVAAGLRDRSRHLQLKFAPDGQREGAATVENRSEAAPDRECDAAQQRCLYVNQLNRRLRRTGRRRGRQRAALPGEDQLSLSSEEVSQSLRDESTDHATLAASRAAGRLEARARKAQLESKQGMIGRAYVLGADQGRRCAQEQTKDDVETGRAPDHGARKLTATHFAERGRTPAPSGTIAGTRSGWRPCTPRLLSERPCGTRGRTAPTQPG